MLQINEILKKVPFFQTLGKESMDFIIDRLKLHEFEKNVDVVKIGDPGDKMFIVVSGMVDVLIRGADGAENKVAEIGPGNYFGEMALMTGEPRSATIKTNQTCEMFSLSKNDFDIILEKYPSISLSLGKIMSQRLRQTLSKASELNKGNAAEISGPKGSLDQKSIMDLFVFCEENSISGELLVVNDGVKAKVTYDKGNMMRVEMEGKADTDALDELLNWTNGDFEIKQKKLTMGGEDAAEEPKAAAEEPVSVEKNEILVIHNSVLVQKIIERSLSTKHWLINSVKTLDGGKNAINDQVFAVIIDAKLPDGTAEEFINSHSNSGLNIIVLALGPVAQKYKEIQSNNKMVRVMENNDMAAMVKMLEEIEN